MCEKGGREWRTNVKWSLVYQWSVLAYSVYVYICIFGCVWKIERMRKDGYWKRKKPHWKFFFSCAKQRKNEDDEEEKNEWKIEAKTKRTRKKIKSPYDAICTARMCNVFDWRISMRAHTLVSGGELNMYWTIEYIYSPTLVRLLSLSLSFSFPLTRTHLLLLFVDISYVFSFFFLLLLLILHINCLGVKFIHANRFDSFQRAALTA